MTIVAFEKQISLKARTYLAKRLFESTEVLFLRKTSNIYKSSKKFSVFYLVEGKKFKLKNFAFILLRTRSAHRLSLQHLPAVRRQK